MAKVLLKKYNNSAAKVVQYTYEIRNLETFSIDLDTAVTANPLPETSFTSNIVVKYVGNSLLVTVHWVINKESTSVVTYSGGASGSDIKTPEEQRNFLLTTFELKSINDLYNISLSGLAGGEPAFSYNGYPTKLSLIKSGSEPITYKAMVTFQVGSSIEDLQNI